MKPPATMTASVLFAATLLSACAHAPSRPLPPAEAPLVEPALRGLAGAIRQARRSGEPRLPSLRIVAGGDVIFGRYIKGTLRRVGGEDPFAAIAPLLGAADIALINLETPVTDTEQVIRPSKNGLDLKFRAPTEMARHVADAGVDVAVLANNHAEDCGPEGIASTIAALDAVGVAHLGTSVDGDPYAPITTETHGVRIAWLAATSKRNRGRPAPGERLSLAYMSLDQMRARLPAAVTRLREAGRHDLIVVTLHWGAGMVREPHPKEIRIARALVDAGAALVLGHHAHILMPVESYRGGLIVYGMGNLVFDMRNLRGRQTALFDLTLAPSFGAWRVEQLVVHPLMIPDPTHGPEPATGRSALLITRPLKRWSRRMFRTTFDVAADRLVWRAPPLAAPAAMARR